MKADYNISYDELKEIRDALKNREKGDICKEYHKKQCESCIYKNLNDIFNKKE